MKQIELTHGKVALVDDEDYGRINKHKWPACKEGANYYAKRHNKRNHKPSNLAMHRVIMGALPGQIIDHIDGNGLNNQKCNLRFCSRQQNVINGKPRGGTSQFKGVHLYKATGKWAAKVTLDYKSYHLGYFYDEIEAAKAYDEAAKKHHGEFACLNFPVK